MTTKEDTSFRMQVIFTNGKRVEYKGFYELRRIDRLNLSSHKGLIAVQDEDVVRWYVYDKYYLNAIGQFNNYWIDTHDGNYPAFTTMDYRLHNEVFSR